MKKVTITPDQLNQIRKAFYNKVDVDSWHDDDCEISVDYESDDCITLYFDARFEPDSQCIWQGDYLHPAEYRDSVDAGVKFKDAVDDDGDPVEILNVEEVENAALDGLYS